MTEINVKTEEEWQAQPWLTIHPLTAPNAAAVAEMRTLAAPGRGLLRGPAARPAFEEITSRTALPGGVTFERDTVSGVPGVWCRPADTKTEGVILHFHSGWYVLGTAWGQRYFAGHIARRVGAATFTADYRLAPEHPFPAALEDAEACYHGLREQNGHRSVALAGESAGGGLALSLLSFLAGKNVVMPVGAVALSPLTDLALTGESWRTRVEADPFFTPAQGTVIASIYPGGHNPKDPLISPLYADLAGLPPLRVYTGDDELLLDDTRGYVARAAAAGVDARAEVWAGMPHVFPSSVGRLEAADAALCLLGEFLTECLNAAG